MLASKSESIVRIMQIGVLRLACHGGQQGRESYEKHQTKYKQILQKDRVKEELNSSEIFMLGNNWKCVKSMT